MRPLKRPMFRNGGPIKEGIMDGMQEPVRRQAALVGDPVFPKAADGRAKHFVQIPMLIGAGINALRAIPAGMRAARFFGATPGKLGFLNRVKDLATIRPGLRLQSGGSKFPDLAEFAAKQAPGTGAGFRIGSFIKQNPILSASAPSLAYDAGRIGGPVAGEALKGVANFLVPGTRFDPFKDDQKSIETKENNTKLKRVDNLTKEKPVGEVDKKSNQLSEDEKNKINEDRINETKQKYYKLMGVDKLNKEATYDSLIDASKIIQEQGGDLKGAVKSGTLQSSIINAISKNLDKSTDLKKQIDAAILKGEIEKDINKGKLTSFQEQIKFIKENPNDPLAKKLAGATSVADIVAASAAQGKSSTITSGDIASMIDSKGTDVSGTIADDEYQKWFKSNKNKDEIDFFIEKYSGADDGLYVVNKKAFIKRGNEIAPVSLDSIIG